MLRLLSSNLLAQAIGGSLGTSSIGSILIFIVIILGCLALAGIAIRELKITIPAWMMQGLGIILLVFVIVFGIRFLMGM